MSAWGWGRPFPRAGGGGGRWGKPWWELVLHLCCPRVAAGEPDTRAPRRASTWTKLTSYFPFSPIHGLNLPHSWTRGFCGSRCQDGYGNAICSRCQPDGHGLWWGFRTQRTTPAKGRCSEGAGKKGGGLRRAMDKDNCETRTLQWNWSRLLLRDQGDTTRSRGCLLTRVICPQSPWGGCPCDLLSERMFPEMQQVTMSNSPIDSGFNLGPG